jgi:DNA polymerase-3 subunit gamma/tau
MAKKKPTPESDAAQAAGQYTVLARRYRPRQFSDLIGQEAVAQALTNALTSNRVAHAYLFTGARGVGKTSTARILAKALNCVNGPTPNPCGTCESCQAIAAGEDIDVLEIDGASNNKVEEARELRQNIALRPARSRYKVYIIDEVHMLSNSAFNALLKTLEEPPPHVKFIFATTEVQKIPVTILSRCQRFDLTGIPAKRIHEHLKQILDQEEVTTEPGVLELVSRRAGGSMRDAQSLLDQFVAFGGKHLTLDGVNRLLGTAGEEQIAGLAQAVIAHEVAKALELLSALVEGGIQLGELLDQLLEYWRDLMLIRAAGPGVEGLTFGPRCLEQLKRQAEQAPLDTILAGLDVLANAKGRLRSTGHGRVVLEMAIVRLARLEDLAPLSEIARQLAGGSAGSSRPSPPAASAQPSAPLPVKKNLMPEANGPAATAMPLNEQNLPVIWAQVLQGLGPLNRADLDRGGFPAISGPNCLVLRFSTNYNSHRQRCEDASRNAILEDLLRKVTGQSVAVRYETIADDSATGASVPRVAPAEQMRRNAAQEPLVKAVLDQLGGNLIRADTDFGVPNAPAIDCEERGENV